MYTELGSKQVIQTTPGSMILGEWSVRALPYMGGALTPRII